MITEDVKEITKRIENGEDPVSVVSEYSDEPELIERITGKSKNVALKLIFEHILESEGMPSELLDN